MRYTTANFRKASFARNSLPWLMLICSLIAGCLLSGCRSQAFYRTQADDDAYFLVAEKNGDPRWHLDRTTITPDPQSRMFDPFSPDCPPMPVDDPAAHQFMEVVDDKDAYWGWERNGVTDEVANPNWLAYLPLNEEGILILDVDKAVEIARVNSPDYQRSLEDLYIAALDVSFQRFQFDAQFFGGYETFLHGNRASAWGWFFFQFVRGQYPKRSNGKAVRDRGTTLGWFCEQYHVGILWAEHAYREFADRLLVGSAAIA